ncbi:hypothetical protein FAGAP_14 [Fusarium agapanthi]|uniref:Uncharacterized protein n=1 Tax=Fusarium agapanthi TaxID=1803897 RepID=A0A9P5ECG8_9HYPO|nr:hypothetical protein FAGAP_14 [Fusarium agapanthi]
MIDDPLVEVDGFLAGLIYLDATDPSLPQKNSKNSFRKTLAVKLAAICNAYKTRPGADTLNVPSSTIRERHVAWSSTRTIRDGIKILWDHFVDVSRVLNTPIIDDLRKSYHGAPGLCYEGVFAFRYIVSGQKPDDLVAIFAFCSLSYVINRLFCACGRAEESDIPAGICSWRDAIKGEDQKQAFDALAAKMWPEAQIPIHLRDVDPGQTLARSTSTHGHSGSTSPVSSSYYESSIPPLVYGQQAQQPISEGTMGYSYVLLQDTNNQVNNGTTSTSTAFSRNPTQLSVSNNEPQDDPLEGWSDSSLQPYIDMMKQRNFAALESQTSQLADGTNLNTGPTQGLNYRGLLETPTHVSDLQKTATFMAVRDYIRDNSNFWQQLAGSGLMSKDHVSLRSWERKLPVWMEYKKPSTYIQQLRAVEHTRNTESRGIVAVAEPLIKWGFLQTIEDIKLYMTGLAYLLFDDEKDYQEFSKWIECFSGDDEYDNLLA